MGRVYIKYIIIIGCSCVMCTNLIQKNYKYGLYPLFYYQQQSNLSNKLKTYLEQRHFLLQSGKSTSNDHSKSKTPPTPHLLISDYYYSTTKMTLSKILFGLGVFLLFHAGYSTVQRRCVFVKL